jgi:F5/8 type C domain/Bacterial Ig domain
MSFRHIFPVYYEKYFTKLFLIFFCFTILIFSSSQINGNFINVANAQSCTTNLPISGVSASGSDSKRPPSYAIDNNFRTWWSNPEIGSWISADLGSTQNICSVDIAWYKGNARQYHFVIATSTDGSTFTNVFNGDSSGTTVSSEKYTISNINARYVRVTVNGNTQNSAASMFELDIFGSSLSGNSPPVASNQAVTTNKNTAKAITLTASDPNNDPLTYSIVTQPAHGTLTGTAPNLNYNPDTDYVGADSFTFKANDGTVDSNTATVSITVQDVSSCATNLPISGVTASGYQLGNPPSNAIDADLNTRWANDGVGSWISADLGLTQNICSVDIAWYNGNARQYHFVIATSTDGSTFTNVFNGDSSGTTVSSEKYTISNINARYVRVTVNGNTQNSAASMFELDIFGSSLSGNSPPVASNQAVTTNKNTAKAITLTASDPNNDPLTYSIVTQPAHGTLTGTAPNLNYNPDTDYVGADSFTFKANDGTVDSNTATVSITVNDPNNDQFGIIKLYPTKNNGEEWYMNMNNPLGDSRFNPQNTITKNPDGSWKMKSTQVRMNVYTSTGYDSNDIPTLDHSVIASKGYMLASNDWRNFEMTQYVKVNTFPSDDNFSPNGRGGRHTGSGAPEGCEGSSMKGDVFFSGKVRFAKEQWHVSYVFTNLKTATGSIEDKWVGIKFIVYNFVENNKVVVKTELWLDVNNNGNFIKVDENVDRGGWGTEGTECGGAPDQIISWGGPITTFRWDTATDVDFKNLSVREISPPQ